MHTLEAAAFEHVAAPPLEQMAADWTACFDFDHKDWLLHLDAEPCDGRQKPEQLHRKCFGFQHELQVLDAPHSLDLQNKIVSWNIVCYVYVTQTSSKT